MFNKNSFYLTVWHFVLHVEPCAWLQLLVNFESFKVQVEGGKSIKKRGERRKRNKKRKRRKERQERKESREKWRKRKIRNKERRML